MAATSLIVELVLTGGLVLLALILPWLMATGGQALEISSEQLALAIAFAFVLGVVLDRAADSILSRWEAYARWRFFLGKRVTADRAGFGETVKDPYPEDYLRLEAMHGPEPVAAWMDQLRVRIRVSRAAAVLLPMLTISVMLGWSARLVPEERLELACIAPAINVGLFVLVFLGATLLDTPKTTEMHAGEAGTSGDLLYWSPPSIWLALEAVFGLFLAWRVPSLWWALGAGALATALAFSAWFRITKTFMSFLWSTALFTDRPRLIEACAGEVRTPRASRG